MFNLYKVKVYKKEKENGICVINFLDNVYVNLLPEGIIFDRVNEFCTGQPLELIDSMDDNESVDDNDLNLIVFKDELKKDNRCKLDDEMLKYYVNSFEDSQFNRFISSKEEEKVKKKGMNHNE